MMRIALGCRCDTLDSMPEPNSVGQRQAAISA
jgi:hypothetical protein